MVIILVGFPFILVDRKYYAMYLNTTGRNYCFVTRDTFHFSFSFGAQMIRAERYRILVDV